MNSVKGLDIIWKFGLGGLSLMGLLLTGEIAKSETKFTQSGSLQYYFLIRIPDAEHVRHLTVKHTHCVA